MTRWPDRREWVVSVGWEVSVGAIGFVLQKRVLEQGQINSRKNEHKFLWYIYLWFFFIILSIQTLYS